MLNIQVSSAVWVTSYPPQRLVRWNPEKCPSQHPHFHYRFQNRTAGSCLGHPESSQKFLVCSSVWTVSPVPTTVCNSDRAGRNTGDTLLLTETRTSGAIPHQHNKHHPLIKLQLLGQGSSSDCTERFVPRGCASLLRCTLGEIPFWTGEHWYTV